jgi:hypothetical protein
MTGPDPGDLFAAHAAHTIRTTGDPERASARNPGPGPDGTASEHAADDLLAALLHWIYAHGGDPENAVADAYHGWQSAMLTARAATRPHLPPPQIPSPLPERPFTLLRHLFAVLDEPCEHGGDVRPALEQIFRDHGWPLHDLTTGARPSGGRARPVDTSDHQDPDNP